VFSSTGLSPSAADLSRVLRLTLGFLTPICWAYNPSEAEALLVWALPLSLATTKGISVDFFSSGYLDVSVPPVPPVSPMDSVSGTQILSEWVAPFGIERIKARMQLPVHVSPVSASFIGSWRQGIHHAPCVA
jgi:hypothetical protein